MGSKFGVCDGWGANGVYPWLPISDQKRTAPIAGAKFSLSVNKHIDRKLLTGAGFFGLGWGLAGICPGPVVSSLGVGNGQAWLFLVAMLLGMLAANKAQKA